MLENDGLKISISRGDTGSVTVNFGGQDVPPAGTIAQVSLQKTKDSEVIWEKRIVVANDKAIIRFAENDTKDLPYGKYCWCLRLRYENGDVWTPMEEPQEFIILAATGEAGDSGG